MEIKLSTSTTIQWIFSFHYQNSAVAQSHIITFTALKHMQIHIQMLPQTQFYEPLGMVLRDKVLWAITSKSVQTN